MLCLDNIYIHTRFANTSNQKKKESPLLFLLFPGSQHYLERQKSTQKIHNNQIHVKEGTSGINLLPLEKLLKRAWWRCLLFAGLNQMAQKLYSLIGPRCVLAWIESKKAKEHKAIKPYAFRRSPSHHSYEEALLYSIV